MLKKNFRFVRFMNVKSVVGPDCKVVATPAGGGGRRRAGWKASREVQGVSVIDLACHPQFYLYSNSSIYI